jgi:hypothetical protein
MVVPAVMANGCRTDANKETGQVPPGWLGGGACGG